MNEYNVCVYILYHIIITMSSRFFCFMTSPSSPRRATPPFRHHPDVCPGYTLDLQLPPGCQVA